MVVARHPQGQVMRRSPLRVAAPVARGGARQVGSLNRQSTSTYGTMAPVGTVTTQTRAGTLTTSTNGMAAQARTATARPAGSHSRMMTRTITNAPKVPPHIFMGTVRESAEKMGFD
mmetsp:Transcript_6096/g.17061  ORF Transcript_6096/g.17061 Transcript_6096/m.17061 type:complete len:116 (-) Transcript_6096:194-541(-)